jgi:hypothetical protein
MTNDEIDALITSRILSFNYAMIRRGQIAPAPDPLPGHWSLQVVGKLFLISVSSLRRIDLSPGVRWA